MKKTILSLALAATGLLAFAQQNESTFTVNAEKSTCKWHAKKVTGQHEGFVKFESGSVNVKGNQLIGGDFTINMTTLEATDLTGEWKEKLVGHLKSDDFFATEKFPQANLRIKNATPIKGAKAGSNNYNIVADLTIKGISKEISFPAMVVVNKGRVIANANFDVDRTAYDIRYGSKSFFADIGDKAIDDKFNLKVRIETTN
ncbi:MAG: YceI family protein [Bacteroidia bacterium]